MFLLFGSASSFACLSLILLLAARFRPPFHPNPQAVMGQVCFHYFLLVKTVIFMEYRAIDFQITE